MLDVSVLRGAVEVALDRSLAPHQVAALDRYIAETGTLSFRGALSVCSPSFITSREPWELDAIESQFLPLLFAAAASTESDNPHG